MHCPNLFQKRGKKDTNSTDNVGCLQGEELKDWDRDGRNFSLHIPVPLELCTVGIYKHFRVITFIEKQFSISTMTDKPRLIMKVQKFDTTEGFRKSPGISHCQFNNSIHKEVQNRQGKTTEMLWNLLICFSSLSSPYFIY